MLCGVLFLVSLLRVKARGPSAGFAAAQFVFMALFLLSIREEAIAAVKIVLGLLVATCMAGDALFRKPPVEGGTQ